MKPPLFHAGQAVVCVLVPDCGPLGGPEDLPNPTLHKIYYVENPAIRWCKQDKCWAITVRELQDPTGIDWWCYTEDCFAPVELLPAEAYAELLEALEPVTA